MKLNWTLALPMAAMLMMPAAARATTLTWDFSGGSANLVGGPKTGDLGASTETYKSGGVNIIASSKSGLDLYGKAGGGDENGLGITEVDGSFYNFSFCVSNCNNEITGSDFVQLDLNALSSGYNTFGFTMNSTTDGETWKGCWSTTAGTFPSGPSGCVTGSSEAPTFVSLGNSFLGRYFDIEATGHSNSSCGGNNNENGYGNNNNNNDGCPSDVLLHSFSASTTVNTTSVPEPMSLLLLGSGIAGFVGRRLKTPRA
jgi:hypothetical protein